jgi:hypothetical protein
VSTRYRDEAWLRAVLNRHPEDQLDPQRTWSYRIAAVADYIADWRWLRRRR